MEVMQSISQGLNKTMFCGIDPAVSEVVNIKCLPFSPRPNDQDERDLGFTL